MSALHLACAGFDSEKLLRALHAQDPDFGGTVLPMLVNELAALAEPVVLMLDDYHLIKEHRCHGQMALLLAHLPPSVQVVIITRADPPLELARMRAAGEMAEIRARELRFGPPQAATLIRNVADVELTGHDLEDMVVRTEGWPAGLYLAALSLRGHPSPGTFVRQFTGNNRFIVDFLVDDVLSKQPADVYRFLTRTSILPRFCAPLCNAVTGSADATAVIELLERENLFLVPLDESREWFRYHHLFAQVLRGQLARTEPAVVPVLHERASGWHRASGSPDEAIGHALAAGDANRATDLIARHYYVYIDSGQVATVRLWLRLLGDGWIAATPLAAHVAAWTAALSGDPRAARRLLQVIEAAGKAGPLPDGMRSFEFSAALLQGTFAFDGLGPMRKAGQRAIGLETDTVSPWHALAHSAFGAALYWSGEFEQAAAHAEEGLLGKASISIVLMLSSAIMALLTADAGLRAAPASSHRRRTTWCPTPASAWVTPRKVPSATWPWARCTQHRETWAWPVTSSSARCRYARRRWDSARGPPLRSCSGWRRCWPTWVTAPEPAPCSARPGRSSPHCRTARTLSSPGWRNWNGGSRTGRSRHRVSRSPSVNGKCCDCSRARCPSAISAASCTSRRTRSKPTRVRSTASWVSPTGRTR